MRRLSHAFRDLPIIGRYFRRAKPTADDVRAFWADATDHFATRRLDANKPHDRAAIAQLLELLGILRKQEFLRRWSITVNDGLYIPYEPGIPTPDWSLWSQIKDCVHGHIRICRERANGGLGMLWHYVTNPAQRAAIEADTYRGDMALEWRYNGHVLNAYAATSTLRNYGCTGSDIDAAERVLAHYADQAKNYDVPDVVTGWACNWLDDRWKFHE